MRARLIWLKGYAHPIRYNDMVARNVIPADLAAKLPPAELSTKRPSSRRWIDSSTRRTKYITENWRTVVVGAIGVRPHCLKHQASGLGKGTRQWRVPPPESFPGTGSAWCRSSCSPLPFLLLPSASIVVSSFMSRKGQFTFQNLVDVVTRKDLVSAYQTSLSISLITAIGGGCSAFSWRMR